MSDETGDRLLARLPALHASHRWALRGLLEALALWGERRLRVVLYADDDFERDIVEPHDPRHEGKRTSKSMTSTKPVRE